MLLDDALHHFDGYPAVPGPIGVHHGDGAAFADPQTVDLGPQYHTGSGFGHRLMVGDGGVAAPWGRCRGQAQLFES